MGSAELQRRRDRLFLEECRYFARRSKDPSTQVGAVIVAPDGSVVSFGYNGFAIGVRDTPERLNDRETKLRLTVHAERNAMLFARRDLTGCTLYTWPLPTCAQCASMVVQCGIRRVVTVPLPPHLESRWGVEVEWARTIFAEAGVEYVEVELTESDS